MNKRVDLQQIEMPKARQSFCPALKEKQNLNTENAISDVNSYFATSGRRMAPGNLLSNSWEVNISYFKQGYGKCSRTRLSQLVSRHTFMIGFQLNLFMLILTAAIVNILAFFHAACATLLIVVVPKPCVYQLIHAIVEMHGSTCCRDEVKKAQYGHYQFLHPVQK